MVCKKAKRRQKQKIPESAVFDLKQRIKYREKMRYRVSSVYAYRTLTVELKLEVVVEVVILDSSRRPISKKSHPISFWKVYLSSAPERECMHVLKHKDLTPNHHTPVDFVGTLVRKAPHT